MRLAATAILSANHSLVNVDAAASLTFAKVNGVRIGNVAIDPLAFGLSIGRRF
jgi:hypothetical protein